MFQIFISMVKEWVLAQGYATKTWVIAQIYATKDDLLDLYDEMMVWVNARGFLTSSYVHRGDPADNDFTENDLTDDGSWHELDLSSIVPAGAKAVHLQLYIKSNMADRSAYLRRHGVTGVIAEVRHKTQVSSIRIGWSVTCGVDGNRKIDYTFSDGGWMFIRLNVLGWWL